MLHSLAFVLARDQALPGDGIDWSGLVAAQGQGPERGRALRLFRLPDPWHGSLDELVTNGAANIRGDDPLPASSERRSLICDAVVPKLEVSRLWIGVYALHGQAWPEDQGPPPADGPPLQVQEIRLLDRFPLAEAANETCWFYPTEDGHYLASERFCSVRFGAGVLAEPLPMDHPWSYDRGDLRLLWSLMADDDDLSCVGLTYQRRRIEFPRRVEDPAPSVTWSSFRVDGMADPSFQRLSTISTYG
jgi:hypothetical protein